MSKWERAEALPDTAILPELAGAYLDPTDVRNGFESVKLRDSVLPQRAEL